MDRTEETLEIIEVDTQHIHRNIDYDAHATPDVLIPPKRPPGRPKGSKNKKKEDRDASSAPSKPRGRPPGTGHLQRARAERLVIRVREPGERIHVKGVPDPTRQRHIAEAAALIQKNNIGNISIPAASRTVEAPAPPSVSVSLPTPPSTSTPSEATAQRIMPEVDPSASITLPEDEDEYSGFLNDGIGDDDEDGDEPDKDGVLDEADPTAEPVDSDGNKLPPKPRRTAREMPKWLQSQFNAHVEESRARGQDNLPALYRDLHTFWFPETDPYFSMRKLDHSLEPQQLYRARFFLWDPAVLVASVIAFIDTAMSLDPDGV
ncbi:hypothetical protein B0H11DRAFT_1927097 [Mycena galericulata]|nr:hypothetical protein B0H11DRAFT_1927097 [Mycena galericulata]